MKTTYKNEQLKRKFYEYLTNVKQFSPKSVSRYKNAIYLYEDFTEKDFKYFNETTAIEFTEWLKNKKKTHSPEKVSLSYCYHILRFLKLFFDWLSKQKGYRKINPIAAEYLQLTSPEKQKAIQPKDVRCPDLDEIKRLIENIKGDTEIEMRDKALFSLAVMTGARIDSLMTLPMKSFDKEKLVLHQNPLFEVRTKRTKNITSALIPFFYKEALGYFLNWYDYLLTQRNFKPENPIFPMTKIENGKDNVCYFNTGKVEPVFWKSQTSLRKIFEKRFKQAGIEYYHPHTFRHFLVKQIAKLPLNEEQKKAFSQNFGHEDIGTTFGSYGYGKVETERQIEIIRNVDFSGKNVEIKYAFGKDDFAKLAQEIIKQQKKDV